MREMVIVTGGDRGIGLAICRRLFENYFVVSLSLTGKFVNDAMDIALPLDIRDGQKVNEMFEGISEQAAINQDLKPVALINNAGIASVRPFLKLEDEDFHSMFATNVLGSFHCAKAYVEMFVDTSRKIIDGSVNHHIINISSVSGLQGFSGHSHYCASKFALNGMSQVMAKELAKYGVAVNNICPSPTDTDMWKQLDKEYRQYGFMPSESHEDDYMSKQLLKRMGKPEDIADAVELLLKSTYITGTNIVVGGGNILR